jgi:hypothetical protein
LAKTYRRNSAFKERKRVVRVQERYTSILQDGILLLAPITEHSRPEEPRAPSPSPPHFEQRFFNWEMSPLSPKPKIITRRASDFIDAFGSFFPVDFHDENPFEPTPLSNSSAMPLHETRVSPKVEDKHNEEKWPSFEPRPLLGPFQAIRSYNEIPTFEGMSTAYLGDFDCLRQIGDDNCHDSVRNVAASFAA